MKLLHHLFQSLCILLLNLTVWLGGAAAMFSVSHASAVTIVRVDIVNGLATPSNPPGNTWGNSFKYLQDALTYVGNLQLDQLNQAQIWVAKGTYRPDVDANNQSGDGD